MSSQYITPTSNPVFPGGLTLTQFIQSVLVGISGFTGDLVRPKWQVAPAKQPDISIDWMAFGIQIVTPDQFAYVGFSDGDSSSSTLQRQSLLEIGIAVYGPNAMENIMKLQDGFQIPNNLEALFLVSMGYKAITPAIRGPDLVNGRWVERLETTLYLNWQVERTYAISSLVAADGAIHTVVDANDVTYDFEVTE